MGDDGRRWNETNVTNANELDEGVGRTTRLAFGHKKIVSYAPFHRHNPTSPTLLVHYCELLAAAACALASSRTLNASMPLGVPHRLPGGLVAEIPEALCLEGAGRPRPSRACGGDEGARARDVTARARGVEGVHLATIRASMGVGDARWWHQHLHGWARAVVQEKARAVVRGAHDDSLHPRLLELREAGGCGEVENRPAVRAGARQAPASEDGMRASDSDEKRVAILARWGRARARTSLRRA